MSFDAITRVYRSCEPNEPLSADDSRYVSLAEARGEVGSWRIQLARDLRRAPQATTFLVSGFLGDGKSTEFHRLTRELTTTDPRMAVVYVNCGDYVNAYSYSFNEILLITIGETGRQLRAAPYHVELRPNYFTRSVSKVWGFLQNDVELAELSIKAKADPFEASTKLALRARDSDTIRHQLWNTLKGDRTTLAEEFARMIREEARPALQKQGYRDLVIILDWLEKLVDFRDGATGDGGHRQLFLHHAPVFQSWGAHLVLTLPIDLVYSAAQEQLTMSYGACPLVIDGARVADYFPEEEREVGRKALRQLLRKRCEDAPDGRVEFNDLFASKNLVDEVITFSGGHPRQLLILLRQCLSFCDQLPITAEAVTQAKRRETQAAARRIKANWYPLLARVAHTRNIANDDAHLEMLRSLCVLSYKNGELIYLVDPAIQELKEFKRALEEAKRAEPAKVS